MTGKRLSEITATDVQQVLVVFDYIEHLPSSEAWLKLLKNPSVHIVVVAKHCSPPELLQKQIDNQLLRGCKIIDIEPLSMVHTIQRIVHSVHEHHHLAPGNEIQEMFERLAEFTNGSPVIIDTASSLLLSQMKPDTTVEESLREFAEAVSLQQVSSYSSSGKHSPKLEKRRTISKNVVDNIPSATSADVENDPWKTDVHYDSWQVISNIFAGSNLSGEERLLIFSLSMFHCCPIPMSVVQEISVLIAKASHQAHLAGSLHSKFLKLKFLRVYPTPIILHPYLSSQQANQTEFVYVPQYLSSGIWKHIMSPMDKAVALGTVFKILSAMSTQDINTSRSLFILGLCSLLVEMSEVNYDLMGKKCYQEVFKLYKAAKLRNHEIEKVGKLSQLDRTPSSENQVNGRKQQVECLHASCTQGQLEMSQLHCTPSSTKGQLEMSQLHCTSSSENQVNGKKQQVECLHASCTQGQLEMSQLHCTPSSENQVNGRKQQVECLHASCTQGQLEMSQLHCTPSSENQVDGRKQQVECLHASCTQGQLEMSQLHCTPSSENQVNGRKQQEECLHASCTQGQLEMSQLHCTPSSENQLNGRKQQVECLHASCTKGQLEMSQLHCTLSSENQVNGRKQQVECLHASCTKGQLEMSQLHCTPSSENQVNGRKQQVECLHASCTKGQLEMSQLHCTPSSENQLNGRKQQEECLHASCTQGQLEMSQLHCTPSSENQVNGKKQQVECLHASCTQGQLEVQERSESLAKFTNGSPAKIDTVSSLLLSHIKRGMTVEESLLQVVAELISLSAAVAGMDCYMCDPLEKHFKNK